MDYLADIHECKFRDDLVALESAVIEMEQAALECKTAGRLSEIHAYEAELRCYAEGGDVFTLADYYEAAEQKDAANKEGLFQKIWAKVKNVWNKIRNFLAGQSSGGDEKDMVEVNGPMYTLANLICECGTEINKMVAHPIQYFKNSNGWGRLAEIAAFTAATKGVKKVARGELEKLKEKLNGLVEKVTGPFDKIPDKIKAWVNEHGWGKEPDEVEGFIPKFLANMSSAVAAVTSALHIGKKDDENQNNNQNGNDGKTDGQNGDGNNGGGKTDGQQPTDQTGQNDGGHQPQQTDQNGQNGQNNGGQNNPPQNGQNGQNNGGGNNGQQTDQNGQNNGGQNPPPQNGQQTQTNGQQQTQNNGGNNGQNQKGFVGKAVEKAKNVGKKAKRALLGPDKEENGKTESGEDFIDSIFGDIEGFSESDDSDIQHLIDNMDEDFEESGEQTVMETVDELTEIFEGYF